MVTNASKQLQTLAMFLGMPDQGSLSTLNDLLPEHGWLQPAVDELTETPLDHWRGFLLLTPWMLARIFVPDNPPDSEIPAEWRAEACRASTYTVMGPTVSLDLLTGKQKAHLNYCTNIGHYLLHPLILTMNNFETPGDVFTPWNKIIEARNANLEQMQRENLQHKEISRRAFFSGLRRNG
ncbi:MAG: [NiFe]-hydrogenase assembly chaperone HybE [Sedimenticola sp.]